MIVDQVEQVELPARVAGLRELAETLDAAVGQLRATQRLVLCAAREIEKQRRASIALGESERESVQGERDTIVHPLLSIKDVTRLLGVSRQTLHRWDRDGLFVRPVQLTASGRKGYLKNEVEDWLQSSRSRQNHSANSGG